MINNKRLILPTLSALLIMFMAIFAVAQIVNPPDPNGGNIQIDVPQDNVNILEEIGYTDLILEDGVCFIEGGECRFPLYNGTEPLDSIDIDYTGDESNLQLISSRNAQLMEWIDSYTSAYIHQNNVQLANNTVDGGEVIIE